MTLGLVLKTPNLASSVPRVVLFKNHFISENSIKHLIVVRRKRKLAI